MNIKNIFEKISQDKFILKVKFLLKDKYIKFIEWIKKDVRKIDFKKIIKKLRK